MNDHAYIAEVRCGRLQGELLVNGWPAYRITDPEHRIANLKLNLWLIEGDNDLRLRLGYFEGNPEYDRPHIATFRLFKTLPDRPYIHDRPLLLYRWTEQESPLPEGDLTDVWTHTLSMKDAFGPFGWTGATPYMPADRPAIEALVSEVHQALDRRDRDALFKLLAMKHEELGRALGMSPLEMSEHQNQFFDLYLDDDDWRMLPLDTRALVLRSGASGRLVGVERVDGRIPLLGVGDGGKPFEMPLCVSCIGGTWTVVR